MHNDVSALTRRNFIKISTSAGALLLGGALLEACGGSASSSPAAAASSTAAKPSSAAPASSAAAAAKLSTAASTKPSAAASASTAASPAGSAQASGAAGASGPLKLGFLSSFTGDQAEPGGSLYNGFDLYLTQHGMKLGGRTISVVKADEASNPKTGLDQAKKLVEQDKVDVMAGVVLTPSIYAIRDYMQSASRKIMVVDGNAGGDALDTKMKSDYIVRVSFSNQQANIPMGTYVYKDLGLKTAVVATEDYAAGHEKIDAFKKTYLAAGGKVLGEVYPPLGNVDFAAYLPKIQQAKAETTYAFFSGTDALHFIQQYAQFGLNKGGSKLTGCTDMVDDSVLQAEGQAAAGAITVGQWGDGLDTPENKKFMADYQGKYNKAPNMFAEQGYNVGILLDAALKKTSGATEPAKLLAAMLGQKWTAPRGPVTVSEQFHDVVQNMYVFETKSVNGKLVNQATHTFESVPPAQAA